MAVCLSFVAGVKMSRDRSVISGVVRDPKGQPVVDARVYFKDGPVPLPDIAVLTDSKGKFSLSAPAVGTYMIECTADGFASTTVTVNARRRQDTQVEIRLRR